MAHSPTDDLRDLRAVFSEDVTLNAPERAVMGVLILHRNGDTGRTDPSVSRLAAATGYNRRTIMRVLASLEDGGHITRRLQHGCRTRYVVNPPTGDTESLVTESHRCHSDTGPVTESHQTGDTESPERTKNELTNERGLIPELWTLYCEALDGALLKLTAGRRKKLDLLKREQLDRHSDPLALFRAILAAVRASDFHMAKRSYLMPESLFVNEARREKWALEGMDILAGKTNGKNGTTSHDPLMLTTRELRK